MWEEKAMLQAARWYERQQQEEAIAFATAEFLDDDDDEEYIPEDLIGDYEDAMG